VLHTTCRHLLLFAVCTARCGSTVLVRLWRCVLRFDSQFGSYLSFRLCRFVRRSFARAHCLSTRGSCTGCGDVRFSFSSHTSPPYATFTILLTRDGSGLGRYHCACAFFLPAVLRTLGRCTTTVPSHTSDISFSTFVLVGTLRLLFVTYCCWFTFFCGLHLEFLVRVVRCPFVVGLSHCYLLATCTVHRTLLQFTYATFRTLRRTRAWRTRRGRCRRWTHTPFVDFAHTHTPYTTATVVTGCRATLPRTHAAGISYLAGITTAFHVVYHSRRHCLFTYFGCAFMPPIPSHRVSGLGVAGNGPLYSFAADPLDVRHGHHRATWNRACFPPTLPVRWVPLSHSHRLSVPGSDAVVAVLRFSPHLPGVRFCCLMVHILAFDHSHLDGVTNADST
jgi:hypothetical protein